MNLHLHVRRFVAIVSLLLSLVAAEGVASAQETLPVINADGSSGTSTSGVNPAVDADGPTVVYGDVNVGPGTNVIGTPAETVGDVTAADGNASTLGPGNASASPGTVTRGSSGTELLGPDGTYSVTDAPPSNVTVGESGAPAPAPAPVADTTTTETVEPVIADTTAVASDDQDGDNLIDAREYELGLDPTNPDTDGDGVADGDEIDIYGTDPWVWDTDGDGIGDGDELFGGGTDPLVADGGGEVANNESGEAAGTDLAAASGGAAVDSDNDRLADVDEAALGTDPNNPDSDGDGYFDGDEAALGSDPFDPASFPAT